MTSTIYLFKNCKILPERNFKVDSLITYLNTLTKETINNFQYVKNGLNISIKIRSSQINLEMISANNYNYCRIKNGTGGNDYYYFVVNKKWISEGCIELTLSMDTINTFLDNIVLSSRTKIYREHKDRFEVVKRANFTPSTISTLQSGKTYFTALFSSNSFGLRDSLNLEIHVVLYTMDGEFVKEYIGHLVDYNNVSQILKVYKDILRTEFVEIDLSLGLYRIAMFSDNHLSILTPGLIPNDIFAGEVNYTIDGYKPLIDFYSEGLNPVLFKKKDDDVKDQYYADGTEENNSFYLIYENSAEPTTEDPNPPVDTYLCADEELEIAGEVSPTKFSGTQSAIINPDYYEVIYANDGNADAAISLFNENGSELSIHLETNQALFIQAYFLPNYGVSVYAYKAYYNGSNWVSIESYDKLKLNYNYADTSHIRYVSSQDTSPQGILDSKDLLPSSPVSGRTIKSFNDIVRTSPTLLKIIKLPYCPTAISKNESGKYYVDGNVWSYDATKHLLKLNDNQKFEKVINLKNSLDIFEPLKLKQLNFTKALRNINYENKLFHSDYYQPKFVYDSFGFVFQLEKMNEYSGIMQISFITTSTINSRFMFVFNNYSILGKSQSDYDNVMPVARNNEMVLYNSDYLNYIRTGFNYDVKTKERQQENTIVGSVAQGVGGIVSFLGGIATANPALVAAGVGLFTSLSVNVITTANSIAQSEQNIEAKLKQTRMQSVSVAGSDDVDLMSYYTNGNKAKICIYEVSEKLKQALFDVFYFTGYVSDKYGIPTHTSRKYFNFVSAEIVFSEIPNLPSDIVEDVRNKYKNGITFLHEYREDSTSKWDFEQQFENWETSLLN